VSGRRYAVVGGGNLGAAVSRRLLQLEPDAQVTLLERDGSLVDDVRITRGNVLAVRNAPSPAATSSLAIAEHLVDVLLERQPILP